MMHSASDYIRTSLHLMKVRFISDMIITSITGSRGSTQIWQPYPKFGNIHNLNLLYVMLLNESIERQLEKKQHVTYKHHPQERKVEEIRVVQLRA